MANKNQSKGTVEINAIRDIVVALEKVEAPARTRVLKYAADMLGITLATSMHNEADRNESSSYQERSTFDTPPPEPRQENEIEGINPVAIKWMKRSGFDPSELQKLFSLGQDEIDLVTKDVPGKSKRERMRNVLLLKAIAAYLGTGAARVMFEQLKEACLHYKAYDATNFATHLRSVSADASGTKETGFTLTPRGLSAATDLVKSLLA